MYLELRLRPTVGIISAVRRSIMSLYERVLADPDASARVGLVTHELLENVLRHSSTGDTTLNIRISLPESVVWVETTNQATPDNIAQLRARATSIATVDPDEAYLEAMRASVGSDKIGGLGLARIAAEGGMKVDVRTEGDTVHVVACTTFGAAA